MILDSGICSIFHVDKPRGALSPVDGLEPFYEDWYGVLRSESGNGKEPGDLVRRIRVHDCAVSENDIVADGDHYWVVTRSYHGTDDDTGEGIADLTLERGARHFVKVLLHEVSEDIERGKIARDEGESREVYGHVGAVGENEYYSSQQAGYDLECTVTVHSVEYSGESRLTLNGVKYRIVRRTLNMSAGLMVLACERVRGRG